MYQNMSYFSKKKIIQFGNYVLKIDLELHPLNGIFLSKEWKMGAKYSVGVIFYSRCFTRFICPAMYWTTLATNCKRWGLINKSTYKIFIVGTGLGKKKRSKKKRTNKQREQVGKTTTISWMPDSSSLLPQRRQNMQEEFHFVGIT